jgi:hypothetical protein
LSPRSSCERPPGFRCRNTSGEVACRQVNHGQEDTAEAPFDKVFFRWNQQICGENNNFIFEEALIAKEVG